MIIFDYYLPVVTRSTRGFSHLGTRRNDTDLLPFERGRSTWSRSGRSSDRSRLKERFDLLFFKFEDHSAQRIPRNLLRKATASVFIELE